MIDYLAKMSKNHPYIILFFSEMKYMFYTIQTKAADSGDSSTIIHTNPNTSSTTTGSDKWAF